MSCQISKVLALGYAFILTLSCQQGDFTGDAKQVRMQRQKPCVPTAEKPCTTNTVPTTPTPSGTIDGQNQPLLSTDSGGLCLKRPPIIDFVFAMDVSGSMQDESDRVKQTFTSLANNLANISIPGLGKVPKVRFGLVTFEDSILFSSPLNDDRVAVQTAINAHFKAEERNTDVTEGGFLGAASALELAKAGGESVKVLLIVTDAYSHDGTGNNGNRNYNSAIVDQILRDPIMKLSFVYSASDFSGGSNCLLCPNPTPNAVGQWQAVRQSAAVAHGRSPLGVDFALDPGDAQTNGPHFFNGSNLMSKIPADIGQQLRKCVEP